MTTRRSRNMRMVALTAGAAVLATAVAAPSTIGAVKTKRVSVTSGEVGGTQASTDVDISADGKFVVMASRASLALPDPNGTVYDVYIRNVKAGTTKLISKSTADAQGNGNSRFPSISANGRFIAFESIATNLAGGAVSGRSNIYLHDRKTGRTKLISRSRFGGEADDASRDAAISGNGRFIAYESSATDITPKDSRGFRQVYVYDRKKNKTRMRSVTNKGKAGNQDSSDPVLSARGNVLVYESEASNLFRNDKNGSNDVFARYPNGKTVLVSKTKRRGNGDSQSQTVSANGRYIVYMTEATNLIKPDRNGTNGDILRFDRKSGKTKRVGLYGRAKQGRPGDGTGAREPWVSGNGRYVVWEADTTRMGGDTNGRVDVYRRDVVRKKTKRVSNTKAGKAGDDASFSPRISVDGRFVAFTSAASDLVGGDGNGFWDAFRRGRY